VTRTPSTASLAAVVTVLALSLTACGGSGDDASQKASAAATASRSAEEQTASKNISDGIVGAQSSGTASDVVQVGRKDADCIGDGLVDKIGVDKLQKYKILDKDLKAENDITQTTMSSTDAKAATDVFFSCTDMKALVNKAISGSGKLSSSIQSCIDKSLTDASLRAFLTATLEGKATEAQKALTQPLTKCVTS